MQNSSLRLWRRHFFYRAERLRTTWKFRFGIAAVVILLTWATSRWWTAAIADSLICERDVASADAILIENFDPDYLLFERAAALRQRALASRVLVPVPADAFGPNTVARAIAQTMAEIGRVGAIELVPIREVEPISLNAALDVRDFVMRRQIRSVIVVAPLFRSRRSALVYGATLGRAGISVRCEPVAENRSPESWTSTSHGVQNVLEQWLKLQYYRFYVLPFKGRS